MLLRRFHHPHPSLYIYIIYHFGATGFLLDSWTLRMGPIGCLEMSARNYHYLLRNNPEKRVPSYFAAEACNHAQYTSTLCRRFERLQIKKAKLLSSLSFLLWCRDQNTIHHFLQLRHYIQLQAASRIYSHISFCLLRKRIHPSRMELESTSWELLEIHLHLAGALSELDWTLTDRLSFKKASSIGENSKTRQCNKFLCLHRAQHHVPPASKETVVNLSGKLLDDAVYSALRKSLNYAVALAVLPIEDILTEVEKGCQITACWDSWRSWERDCEDTSGLFWLKDNLNGAKRRALRALRKNTDLTILLADKGNATVVLNTVDYSHKIGALLQSPAYRKLAK